MDFIDLGNQKKTQSATVFEHSEHFLRLYHLRSPKQPAGISRFYFPSAREGVVPVKTVNLVAVANYTCIHIVIK